MKDKDDNQKFLEKFKDQITTMGKKGILESNDNSKFNNNFNINTKVRKGSAFLKPINKAKIKNNNDNNNITEPVKNDLPNNEINKNMNNPYITNTNNNISPILFYKYQNPYMYYNYNTNLYMNNNIQPGAIYPPYQLYYYPNPNMINPYLIQNNYQNIENKENNEITSKPLTKKKLRPISAQNISNNRSYLTNQNNITNLTYLNNKSNMTNINRHEYKPYTLKDYKEIMNVDTLGGLGANIGTEDWNKKKEKMDKMNEYAKNIFKKTKGNKNKNSDLKNKKKEEISTRKRASEYSKLIRPKSSGHVKVNITKQKNDKVNVINNENIIQGKMALINAKKLNDKNNNNFINLDKKEDKMKEIFNDNPNENEDDKEMMEYYNKFKINDNEILEQGTKDNKDEINFNINDDSEDSLEIKKEENNNINNINIKKFRTFKEQRNAANNKNNNMNFINKDNNINEEYNEKKEKEVVLESLFSQREKYLKEIEEIKKGLQQ